MCLKSTWFGFEIIMISSRVTYKMWSVNVTESYFHIKFCLEDINEQLICVLILLFWYPEYMQIVSCLILFNVVIAMQTFFFKILNFGFQSTNHTFQIVNLFHVFSSWLFIISDTLVATRFTAFPQNSLLLEQIQLHSELRAISHLLDFMFEVKV